MPGFDRTGPVGDGPMTGRRMGRCTGYGLRRKDENADAPENFIDDRPGRFSGRGAGFGWRRGGRGLGRGFQNRFRGGF